MRMNTKRATKLANDVTNRLRDGEILPLGKTFVGCNGDRFNVWIGNNSPVADLSRQEAIGTIVKSLTSN